MPTVTLSLGYTKFSAGAPDTRKGKSAQIVQPGSRVPLVGGNNKGGVPALNSFAQAKRLAVRSSADGPKDQQQSAEKNAEKGGEGAHYAFKSAASQVKDGAEKWTSVATKTAEDLQREGEERAAQLRAEAERVSSDIKGRAQEAGSQLADQLHETAEVAKENLAALSVHAPGSIKNIADTAIQAHSKEAAKRGAKIHDFCLGIPYGAFLFVSGLSWFLLSGSVSALRFGVGLGGLLLASSVLSLRAWQQGRSSTPYIAVQSAIAFALLVKEVGELRTHGYIFQNAIVALLSAAMLAFFAYVVLAGGNPPKEKTKAASGFST